MADPRGKAPPIIGRYTLAAQIGAGGMASIYLGRQLGGAGFSRVVALKRLHPHYANEPDFVAMFLDEARLAARVRHPNVVETLDVVQDRDETMIVLEYIDGESLSMLAKKLHAEGSRLPMGMVVRVIGEVCCGLHAAHEARGPDGAPLGIVHRDVSPQNVLIATDGIARVADFGVAHARGRLSHTKSGQVKGKPAYMAPEQLAGADVTRGSDIYAVGVMLWELCAGRRAYEAPNEGALFARVLTGAIPRLEDVAPWVPHALVEVVERALQKDPSKRFATALEMSLALGRAAPIATQSDVALFVEHYAKDALSERRAVAGTLDLGAAAARGSSASIVLDAPTGEGGSIVATPPAGPPKESVRPLVTRDDTQQRITHTVTAARPGQSSPSRVVPVAFAAAIVLTALVSGSTVWFATRRKPTAIVESQPTQSMAEEPSASESSVIVAPLADVAPPAASPVPPMDESVVEPSISASEPALSMSAPTKPHTSDRIPSRSLESVSASSSAQKKCDPPYFIDDQGIRRVKRDCF